MKTIIPLILVVEDNPDVLTYIKMVLEHNDCEVITAENGKDGLDVLSKAERNPDLIISDIMMPEMDGYDFFKTVSDDIRYGHIPFVFLSALDSKEDIRLGKLLGADDYLTKPINEDDLTASVAGKILRNKKNRELNEKLKLFFDSYKTDTEKGELETDKMHLIEVMWDDLVGPKLTRSFPEADEDCSIPLKQIGSQIYDAATSIYGQGKRARAEGVLINLENFKVSAYAYFDAYMDLSFRGGERDYMYAVIAPFISYLQSLMIKEILNEISSEFKKNETFDLKPYWEKIANSLSNSLL